MMRQLRELDRADAGAPHHSRTTGRWRQRLVVTAVGAAVLTGGTFVVKDAWQTLTPAQDNGSRQDGVAQAGPAETVTQADQPLGAPPKVRQGVGTFRFTSTHPGTDQPVAYDPCREIPYAVNTEHSLPKGNAIIDEAVREVERATGLVFVRRPDTEEHAEFHLADQTGVPGPVVIEWAIPGAVAELTGEPAGWGGSLAVEDPGSGLDYYVSGAIALDTYDLERLHETHGRAAVRAVVMHELGHVVGLDHVRDKDELMHEDFGQTAFGPGDREGLALLGAGQCLS